MSRKEEMGDVGQTEIAGNFNTRFIFLKEEKVQIAAVAETGESYRNKITARGFSRTVFFVICFCKVFYYFLNNFLRPKPATPIRITPSNSMEVGSEIVLPKFSAKACPVNTKLIKNIAKNETIKTTKTLFMKFLLLQKSNFNI
jgi:hypothetical protein